jgi:hypothetical protein
LEKISPSHIENKVIKVRIRRSKTETPELGTNTLFSQKDIRQMVTEFVSAWIRGDIVIRFPTAAELSKKNPLAIAFPTDPSVDQELKIKEHYIELLLTCAGLRQVSASEQEQAIADTFKILLMFRSANRIEGKIRSSDIEKRVTDLEEKQKSTSTLLEQITGFLFKEEKKPT